MIDFKTGSLPPSFRFTSFGVIVVGLIVTTSNIFAGLAIILVSLAVYMVKMGTQFDVANKRYREYVYVLGVKFGTWYTFNFIEKMYLNKVNTSQKMYSARTTTNTTIRDVSFRLYLKFDDGETLIMCDEKRKGLAEEKAEILKRELSMELYDNTI